MQSEAFGKKTKYEIVNEEVYHYKDRKVGKLRSESSTPISVRQQTLLIKRLCDRGSSEPKEPKHKRNMKGETLLHRAAMAGDVELLRKLLPEYTDVDVRDYAGKIFNNRLDTITRSM